MGGGTSDGGGESFDALLRRYRAARGMTQAALAERSGLSVQAVSLLERGLRRGPRITTVEFLAQALRLEGGEREALRAAAEAGREPDGPAAAAAPAERLGPAEPLEPAGRPGGARRWRLRGPALVAAALVALIVTASLGWTRAHDGPAQQVPRLVGARAHGWPAADQQVGPLQTQRIYHDALPASFAASQEGRLPAGVVPIVSYRTATAGVRSYVASVSRPLILVFRYNPEPRMAATAFVSAFEEQSRLIRSVGNSNVRVATSALIYQYQAGVNAAAVGCGYVPPAAYVDYYLAAVYEPYLQGIDRTDRGGFVVWQSCTRGQHRPRGLVEYGLGLGTHGSAACQPESSRTSALYRDLAYLHANVPDLAVLEYWWSTSPGAPCAESWQFPAGSSTADVWRTVTNRAFGL